MPTTSTIHTYTASEAGLFANCYLIETADGVVAVDTNLLVSDARAFKSQLRQLGKPLLAVFITHAHPDHFNGTVELVDGDETPVYATPLVAQSIGEVADAKRAQWSPTYGDEWPSTTHYPNSSIVDGETVSIGDISVRAHELGPGESHADSYFIVTPPDGDRPLGFIGDVAFNGTHAYTADGHTAAWLATLDRLTTDLDGTAALYPGHGAPGGVDLLAAQQAYLHAYRDAVRDLAQGASSLSDEAKQQLGQRMGQALPEAPLGWLVALGADAVARELATETDAGSAPTHDR